MSNMYQKNADAQRKNSLVRLLSTRTEYPQSYGNSILTQDMQYLSCLDSDPIPDPREIFEITGNKKSVFVDPIISELRKNKTNLYYVSTTFAGEDFMQNYRLFGHAEERFSILYSRTRVGRYCPLVKFESPDMSVEWIKSDLLISLKNEESMIFLGKVGPYEYGWVSVDSVDCKSLSNVRKKYPALYDGIYEEVVTKCSEYMKLSGGAFNYYKKYDYLESR